MIQLRMLFANVHVQHTYLYTKSCGTRILLLNCWAGARARAYRSKLGHKITVSWKTLLSLGGRVSDVNHTLLRAAPNKFQGKKAGKTRSDAMASDGHQQ